MANMTEKEWLSGIKKGLSEILDSNKKALPDGFNKDRFMLNCITVIQDMLRDNKKKGELQKIDPTTIPICLAKGAYLGLDFFNGECYCIPYSGEAKFQTDYKGEIKLCKRYSKNPIYFCKGCPGGRFLPGRGGRRSPECDLQTCAIF